MPDPLRPRPAITDHHDKEAIVLYSFALVFGAALGVAMGLWL